MDRLILEKHIDYFIIAVFLVRPMRMSGPESILKLPEATTGYTQTGTSRILLVIL